MKYLALCCIVKDEDYFIKEWIAYHALLGVEHFYIYDNMSKKPVQELLGEYVSADNVTIFRVEGEGAQIYVYQDCLDKFGSLYRWIGFIDIDEFVCPINDSDLRVVLSEYEEYAGLGIAWKMFSSNGHMQRPRGLVTESYTEVLRGPGQVEHLHVKSFVDPSRVLRSANPHYFVFKPNEYMVNEDHFPIPAERAFTFSQYKKVALHHYYYRSQQDFEEKIVRGRADFSVNPPIRKLERFYLQAKADTVQCTDILRFVPALKKSLASSSMHKARKFTLDAATYSQIMDMALSFVDARQYDKAQLCLCEAALRFSGEGDLWVLRAMLARHLGHLDRAEVFIRRAFRHTETTTAYRELISLYQARNDSAYASMLEDFYQNRLLVEKSD